MLLKLVRYGLPGVLVLAALIVLFAVHGSLRYDGFAMLLGSGLGVAFLNSSTVSASPAIASATTRSAHASSSRGTATGPTSVHATTRTEG